ncbi:MAG: hypothetical protein Q7W05_10995 [Deltaproteobacteria bacterium]|nr:hypothetical protein [Deltaproteobacteria bacterium]
MKIIYFLIFISLFSISCLSDNSRITSNVKNEIAKKILEDQFDSRQEDAKAFNIIYFYIQIDGHDPDQDLINYLQNSYKQIIKPYSQSIDVWDDTTKYIRYRKSEVITVLDKETKQNGVRFYIEYKSAKYENNYLRVKAWNRAGGGFAWGCYYVLEKGGDKKWKILRREEEWVS